MGKRIMEGDVLNTKAQKLEYSVGRKLTRIYVCDRTHVFLTIHLLKYLLSTSYVPGSKYYRHSSEQICRRDGTMFRERDIKQTSIQYQTMCDKCYREKELSGEKQKEKKHERIQRRWHGFGEFGVQRWVSLMTSE